MGTSFSSVNLGEEETEVYSPVCCFRSKSRPEEVVCHLSWQRSSLRESQQGKPGPPEGIVKVEEITHNSIVLSWLSPLNRGLGHILAYHVERYAQKDKKWQTVTETCQGTSYKVRDLSPGTKYLFRVRAENMHGVSRPGLESDPIVLPLNDCVDSVTSDMPTTFTRRGSNFLDSDSGVKTIVNRSLDGNDNLEQWSFPRQQKRRRSTLDSLLKRPYNTSPRRMTYSPGFRDSMRIVKHNPLFSDSFEQSPEPFPAKKLPLNMQPQLNSSTTELLSPSSGSQDQITAFQNDLDKDEDEVEMAVIITKDILPTVNASFTSQNSQNSKITDTSQNTESFSNPAKFSVGDTSVEEVPVTGSSVNSENSRKSVLAHSASAEALPLQGHERLYEFDLDDTGVKVPMKRLSSSNNGRFNIRKPLHAKLFLPPGEDSLDEYDIDETGQKVPMQKTKPSAQSEEEPLSDAIDEIVHSLTSLYHSQLSLSENKAEPLPHQEEINLPTTLTKINQKVDAVIEPLTSEYDGSASDSDEGRSTIPPVLPVFIETDSSCDDDPTDTSVSSHKEVSSDSEPDDEDVDSDSELSLTDYFGDESDDSADIDSFDEGDEKHNPPKQLDTSKDKFPKGKSVSQQQEVNAEVHAAHAPQKVKYKTHHRSSLVIESDSPVSEPNSFPTPRTFKHKLGSNQKLNLKQEVVPGSESQLTVVKKIDSNPVLATVFLDMENPDSTANCVTPNRQSLTSIRSSSSSLQNAMKPWNFEENAHSREEKLSENLLQNAKANCKTIDVDVNGAIKLQEADGIDEEAWPSPPGSDEGVDMDTTSDTEVIIIHSTEVIDRLQELMAKDPKLAEMLSQDPRFQQALNTNKILKEKPAREAKPKVSFAGDKKL
ncbi:uncharacterized protein LOC135464716 [Liolophura sinensis]|uniref:uncharacterized protein LOC135464716 n=1 Tax=Liolophura sinensis TaxID=3198878 RepID=UPI003158203A